MAVISLKNINVTFKQKKREIVAVQDESIEVEKGDIYGIVGYSGAGKSTLVRTINLLQRPTKGSVIFQHFNLMNELTIFGNVAQPLKHSNLSKVDKAKKVNKLLKLVGLDDRADNYPNQLSGGQKQRVAIARALANDPEILISDEATSALDPRTTNQILALLKQLNRELGLTIVLITHEMQAIKETANKVAVMENGTIIERGSLLEIFTNPQKPLTKDFINTATNLDEALVKVNELLTTQPLADDEELIKISYVGADTAQPLLSTIYADFDVTTNILYSNMEILTQTPVGLAVAIFKGTVANRKAAKASFSDHGVVITELQGGTN
jgi:D-methionine transport system ATP-binding protein